MGAAFSLLIIAVVAGLAIMAVVKNLLYICQPNEVLIFSGRHRRLPSGQTVGYRIIKGGRTLRVPLFERVDRMNLTNMNIKVSSKGAFSRGGIPLNVEGVANLKIAGHEPVLNNAIERLLGKPWSEIQQIAKDTLEGNLRGVLATLTPEEVNEDKVAFAESLLAEAAHDLERLGFQLDTLTIQNVSDDMGYLDSIGRKKNAVLQKDVAIAEACAKSESAIKDAENSQTAALAQIGAEKNMAVAANERRVADVTTRKEALVAEQRSEVAALVARAKADMAVQQARVEMTSRRLEAEVIQPARAAQEAEQARARGAAAKIVEDGRATVAVLAEIAAAWKQAGPSARDVFLIQKLDRVMRTLLDTIQTIQVDRLTLVDSSRPADAGGAGFDVARAVSTLEQVKAALGVDLPLLVERLSQRLESKPK